MRPYCKSVRERPSLVRVSHDDYRHKVAIITGGASGIGAALGKHLGALGARVVLADRQVELAESVAAAIRAAGGSAIATELDVRELESMKRVVADAVARWGMVDYFFNNAGIGVGGQVADYSMADWDDVLDVNVRGVIHGIQAVYPVMIRQQRGHIINTASIAGLVTTAAQTSYAMSKHAVVALSKSLRVEGKFHGVRVSVLCPGAIRTPILQGGKYGRIHRNPAMREEIARFWETLRPMHVDELAAKVARAVARNEAIIIVPSWWRLVWALERISPALTAKLCELSYARLRELVQPETPAAPAEQAAPIEGDRNVR